MRSFLTAISLVLTAALLGYLISKRINDSPAAEPVVKSPKTYELPKAITRLYQEPRPVQHVANISPDCQRLWNEISSLTLSKTFTPPKGNTCSGLPEPLSRYHLLYTQNCKTPDNTCLATLYQYRAQITHYATRNGDLSQIRDLKILLDKLMASFEHDSKLAARIADRIAELEPSNYPALKAGLLATVLSSQQASGNPNHPAWEDIQSRLARLEKLEPDDRVAQAEMDLLIVALRDNDPSRVLERADELSQTFPKSSFIPYFRAWAENKKGNREGAQSYLADAMKLDPKNEFYQRTWQALQQPGEGEVKNAFYIHQSFPIMPK